MLYVGDCLEVMKTLESESVDLIYLDPPFFTQEVQYLTSRSTGVEYKFNDKWDTIDDYLNYMELRLIEAKRLLKSTGSIFLHCDNKASHYLKILMDEIFGYERFESEIIWQYKRWSNSKKGLLNNHQKILFFSKSSSFKFNMIFNGYSETTNIDQIFQDRIRDKEGKSIYKLDENGKEVISAPKKGVPLNDVWEIPFLNPRAKERVGYPTQKPVELINRIIELVTDENDVVLDPFVGSGTTVVSAKMLNRRYIGIDKSEEAIKLAKERLSNPVISKTNTKNGKIKTDLSNYELEIINSMYAHPIRRNKGIDGVLKDYYLNKPIFFRFQKKHETFETAKKNLVSARRGFDSDLLILIKNEPEERLNSLYIDTSKGNEFTTVEDLPDGRKLVCISSIEYQIETLKKDFNIF